MPPYSLYWQGCLNAHSSSYLSLALGLFLDGTASKTLGTDPRGQDNFAFATQEIMREALSILAVIA